MRISDWSSDVCSSDLVLVGDIVPDKDGPAATEGSFLHEGGDGGALVGGARGYFQNHLAPFQFQSGRACSDQPEQQGLGFGAAARRLAQVQGKEIGRASCRERECQYV